MVTMDNKQTVKTRVLIISDTHNAIPFDTKDDVHAFRQPLPDAEVLIHCGDLTQEGGYEEYLPTVEMLKNHPAEYKLVIAGNHDVTLDEPFYEKMHARFHAEKQDVNKVRDSWCGDEARKAGIVYLEEGVRDISLKNGAKFTVSDYAAVGERHWHSKYDVQVANMNSRPTRAAKEDI